MSLRTTLRPALVATAVLATVVSVPASAGGTHSDVGSASTYGLDRNFTLVGHTDLDRRGMNSPIAVAGPCVYVGDRYYSGVSGTPDHRPNGGIAIVDASDPAQPHQVGLIPPVELSTQREMRADAGLGILVVEGYSPFVNGWESSVPPTAVNYLQVYDIHSDCLHPKLLSTYDFGPRSPHEFFLWKDPKHAGRALAYVTFTIYSPDLMVLDLSDPASPRLVGTYDLGIDQAQKTQDFVDESGSGYLHSLYVSDDGTRAYMATWDYGFYELDTSMFADPAPLGVAKPVGLGRLDYGHNVHSAVPLPGGRPYVVFTQEDYADAGHGCPFGTLRTGKLDGAGGATVVGEFKLPENDPQTCGSKNGTFSSHNPTLFPDLALLTWYSGGLRAVDLTDPAHPYEDGAYVPDPAFTPQLRDTRLFFPASNDPGTLPTDTPKPGSKAPLWTGAMWSYPVVQKGLIYVVDIDLGLYILQYTGPHANEVSHAAFVEGNSSPSRYSDKAPVLRRPAAQWARIATEVAHGPRVQRSPYLTVDRQRMKTGGFICL